MATPEDVLGELLGLAQQQAQQAGQEGLILEEEEDDREYVGDYEEGEYEEGDEEEGDEEEEGVAEVDEDAAGEKSLESRAQPQQQQQQQPDGAAFIRGLEPLQQANGGADEDEEEEEEEEEVGGDDDEEEEEGEGDEWTTLSSLPVPTQKAFVDLLGQLKATGRTELTILMLGKGGVGKSSTVNSLYAQRLANVAAFQTDPSPPQLFARTAAGFSLRVVDTPSLINGDVINTQALEAVAAAVEELGGVDVVLYVDRLDSYRIEPQDKELLSAITSTLGKGVWANTVLGLTRADVAAPPNMSYEEYVNKRGSALRSAIRSAGCPSNVALPLVLIENSSKCPTDEAGQKVLPDGRPWLPMMMSEVVDLALASGGAFEYSDKARAASNPNNKRKWLVPLLLLAQVAFKVFVLDRLLEEDRITGDQYGPYDAAYVAEERQRLKEEQREKAEEARRRAARRQSGRDSDDSSSSDDEDDERDARRSAAAKKASAMATAAAKKGAETAAAAAAAKARAEDEGDDEDDYLDDEDEE